ncbi:MAG: glycosyltransferase family 2 protein [Oscillospiraceae bacterium]|nr:glycosyltransferase family 2 protein [Oscillospiraceae bacterium]
MKTIDLVVPCYNEEAVLPLFYEEVSEVAGKRPEFDFRFLFVNDGSRDGTLKTVLELAKRDERVKYISFSRNFGKEAAMLAGMKYSSGDYVCILDADLQHSPELILDMLDALESDPALDVAAAKRSDRDGENKFKSAFSRQFYKLINKMSSVDIPQSAQDFRVMRRKVVDAVVSLPEYHRFSKGIFSWVGFNTRWFDHENRQRAAGETKWSFGSLLSYAVDGIIGFSVMPLKISLALGTACSFVGLVYAAYIIVRTLVSGSDVAGYPSIICAILIIGGLVLLSLGIIGEYLARIYLEVKHRPVFLIDQTNIDPMGK